MAKNSIQRGEILSLIAPSGGVVSGVPVLIGSKLVIPQMTAAEGDLVACALEEVYRLAKTTGQAYTQLQRVYWDNSGHKLTSVAAGNEFVGIITVAAGSDDTTAEVLLADCCAELGDVNAAIAAVAAAVTDTGTGGNAGKLVKLDGDGLLDGFDVNAALTAAAAAIVALAKLKSGTVTIAAGASAGTVAMGAGTWDGKPVTVSLQASAGDGKIAAATPTARAVIAAGTLTVTLLDEDGVATVNASSGAQTWSYVTDGR